LRMCDVEYVLGMHVPNDEELGTAS
jgi:hypothetical protein